MKYWKITPYHDSEADDCIMLADTEGHHRTALQYAIDRLESGWDGLEVGEKVTVTMELCEDENEEILKLIES